MRKQVLAVLAATLLGSSAFAADNANVQVLANVQGTCKFLAAPDVNFGTLDPGAGGDVNAKTDVSFWCTKGANYTLNVGNGANFDSATTARRMKSATGDYIKYELSPVNASGIGTGRSTPLTFSMNALLRGSDYIDATVGEYQDTVQLTVTP
ncbi:MULTISPECIES: Csu type fimbrial protein [unclassified Variovorax]|uniref:Csu type fimbrial protein n=1 Tax=unclassified Variovorax TaxID=663243 RepID=UPI0013198EFB|nr:MULTISPECIES: spore coat protein U domain-containing protein [unclassified Variovorax]VTU42860.1 putative secreted protein [Variovorax sp. PBL-H6]VTU43626.1 putative secreted protein [Variovorax sp. SRS16]VTU43688.1 putative secreted protein [Variovorax sp. PBL-E5]